jgi:hypothetical protein
MKETFSMGAEPGKYLSDDAVKQIKKLSFDPKAEIVYCTLPLRSIFWTDELPRLRFHAFRQGDDHNMVLRLFTIRIKIWNETVLNEDEEVLWQHAIEQLPEWPIFKRTVLTEEQRLAHQDAEKSADDFFEELSNSADEVLISTTDGITNFSIKIPIKDDT